MNDTIITAIIVSIPPTIVALTTLFVALSSRRRVDALHIAVDGRLTQLLEQTSKASKAAGKVEGKAEEKVEK